MTNPTEVWVFNGATEKRYRFAGGVFRSREEAEAAILRLKLSGTLTKYPVGEFVYEWAVGKGIFTPKRPDQQTNEFIGSFSSASQEHYHYENGV